MINRSKQRVMLFRMLKWIISFFLILCIVIYFLFLGVKSYCGFHRLNKNSIENIVIYKWDIQAKGNYKDSLILSKNQVNSFVRKWNNSYPVGAYKYYPSFTLAVKMKNGQIRDFRIGGRNIKENHDYSFRFLRDDDFFESIWNER